VINESRKLGSEHLLEDRLAVQDVLAPTATTSLVPDLDAFADDPEAVLLLGGEDVAEVVLDRAAHPDALVGHSVGVVAPTPARRHQPNEFAAETGDQPVGEELVDVDHRSGRPVEARAVILIAGSQDATLIDEVVEPVGPDVGQPGADLPAEVRAEPAAPPEVAEALAHLGVDLVPRPADLMVDPAAEDIVHVGLALAAPVALELVAHLGHETELIAVLRVTLDRRHVHVGPSPDGTVGPASRVLIVVGLAALEVEPVVSRNAHVYLL